MSVENQIELLWQNAQTLSSDNHVHKLLKSYYINTCRKLAKNNLQIPKEKFAISQMCSYCGSFWTESEYELKLLPKQLKSTSKTRRIIEIYDKNIGSTNKVLNKRQRNRAKWLKKQTSSHLVIKCCQCKHISLVRIENRSCKLGEKLSSTEEENELKTVSNKHQQAKAELKNKKGGKLLTSAASKLETHREEKSPKASGSKNNKHKHTAPKKVISNTQKQNSLLQLAALLQKQTKVDLNPATKGLQSLLK